MNPDYPPYQPQPQPQPAPQPQPQPQQWGAAPQQDYAMPGAQPVYQQQPSYGPIPPANVPPATRSPRRYLKWMIMTFVFIFTTLCLAGFGVWAYLQYVDNRDNVESKVSVAVADAVKVQADKDAAAFLEKEKQPNRQFVGPDDYGRLSFDYPKTWSVYVAKDATKGGNYEAYFNPGVVPLVSQAQQFAVRVMIEEKDYDKVIETYKAQVSRGDLKSSSVKADEQNGTRLDGIFTKDITGSAVIFKIRDKTVTIRTDANTFKGDFDALIKTITFNK